MRVDDERLAGLDVDLSRRALERLGAAKIDVPLLVALEHEEGVPEPEIDPVRSDAAFEAIARLDRDLAVVDGLLDVSI